MIAKSYSCACTYITHFKVKWLLREKQNVRRFNVSMSNLRSLKMGKYFYHAGNKHEDILLIKWIFSLP